MALKQALRLHCIRIVWSAICRFEGAIGKKFVVVREPELESTAGTTTFSLDRRIVPHLTSEYQNLMLHGRFADALQVPDNLLEYVRGKFSAPSVLRNIDVIFLDSFRQKAGTWESALLEADGDIRSREPARQVLRESIERLSKEESRDVQTASRAFAEAASASYHNGTVNVATFHAQRRSKATTLVARYGSLSNMINAALDNALVKANSQLGELEKNLQPLSSFQFYAPIAAMRNARSHFKCRPLEHDNELRPFAIWIWIFFLEGLQLLVQGNKPIHSRPNPGQVLHEAAAGRWFPTANLVDHMHGSEFCHEIIARFGHLIMLKIVEVPPDLAECARYARSCVNNP
jgi:hypothetical protein